MADTVHFELVSPERLAYSADVEMVVVPGTEGDFAVLPGHAPVISLVRTGVIEVYDQGKVATRIFVRGGFAEVAPSGLTVLAEDTLDLAHVDRAAFEAKFKDVQADIEAAPDETHRLRAEDQLQKLREIADSL